MRWIAILLVAGCGSHPPAPPPPTVGVDLGPDLSPPPVVSNAVLELGGNDAMSQWVALTDGQDVTLVEGAQGGFHVWLRLSVAELPSGAQLLTRTARRAGDGQLVLRSSGSVMVGPNGPGQPYAFPDPFPMFMCPSPIGLSVIDQPIVFRLEFTDQGAAKEITLVPHCPSDPTANAFCMKICTG